MLKRCLAPMAVLFFLILFLSPLALYYSIPFNDVRKLETYYVSKLIASDGDIEYRLAKKKPEDWTSLKQVSRAAQNAIVLSEDWAFYQHEGFDPNQIEEALTDSLEEGKKLRGASTITQQLIKNLFLSMERNFERKIKELILSIYMENFLTKEKILETYLNIVEFGDGLYGIKNAAGYYFNKDPSEITPREGAFLAMLLPSPKRYAQSFRDKKLTKFARKIIDQIIDKMVQAKYLTKRQGEFEKSQRFSWEPQPLKENLIWYFNE